MTDESKQLLLDILVGNAPEEEGVSSVVFEAKKTVENNLQTKLQEVGINTIRLRGAITDTGNSNYLIYGAVIGESGYDGGAIIVLDEDLEVLKVIRNFDSGTQLGEIIELHADEDGNIYGVDRPVFDEGYRFILLNNPAIPLNNDYVVTLRNSYYFPDNFQNLLLNTYNNSQYISKVNGEATYTIVADYTGSPSGFAVGILKINVGSENEWNLYTNTTYTVTSLDYVVQKDENNNIVIDAFAYANTNALLVNYHFNGETLSIASTIPFSENANQVLFVSNNEKYVSSVNYNTLKINIYKVSGNQLINIVSKDMLATAGTDGFKMGKSNNHIFTQRYSTKGKSAEGYNLYDLYSGVIFEDLYYEEYIGETVESYLVDRTIMVKNSYLLYQNIFQIGNTAYSSNTVLKINGFNGESYEDKTSLIPSYGKLYSDQEIVLARNLYNKSINENRTVSVLEIPNNYLNNKTIDNQQLLSPTNNVIINSFDDIEKNVYEAMYLNFINTINIYDNNSQNMSFLSTASNTLNEFINDSSLYDSKKMSKIRFIYIDETSTTSNYSYSKNEDNDYLLSITFIVDKLINKLQFISNDETVVYNEIDLSDCELNKTYTLTQILKKGAIQ